jgi:hypothetical protein
MLKTGSLMQQKTQGRCCATKPPEKIDAITGYEEKHASSAISAELGFKDSSRARASS